MEVVHEFVHEFHSVRYMLKIKMNEIKEICLFDFFFLIFQREQIYRQENAGVL